MPYKTLTIDEKIEQLEAMAKGYQMAADRDENEAGKGHWQHHADFSRDLINDLKHLKDMIVLNEKTKEVHHG